MEHLTRGKIAEMKVQNPGIEILITKEKITIQVQFRNMDQNQNGYLSFNELETICRCVIDPRASTGFN